MDDAPAVTIRDWSEADLPVLEATMGDPAATRDLGGPESPEKLRDRHRRYAALAGSGAGRMFVILAGGEPVGSVGYWDIEWEGEPVYETGWSVRPSHHGRGIASRAAALALDGARAAGRRRYVHAFPSVENVASIAICRSLGFELLGENEVEFPEGHPLTVQSWRYDLTPDDLTPDGGHG